jgi:hypothetical protein
MGRHQRGAGRVIMADRFWVGGTGNWRSDSTTNWSATSGGAGGASTPGSGDNVFFDANSNTGTDPFTVSVNESARSCNNFDATAVDGVMTLAGNQTLNIYGNLALPASNFVFSRTGVLVFLGGAKTINFNGNAYTTSIFFTGSETGVATLLSDITTSSSITINQNGVQPLNLNGFKITATVLNISGAGVKTLTFGAGGKFDLTSSGTVVNYTAGTLAITDPDNADILLSAASGARTVNFGAGISMGTLTLGGSTGALTIQGSNTFKDLESTRSSAFTINITQGTTQAFKNFTLKGASGALATLQSTGAGAYTFSYIGTKLVDTDYLNISNSSATPAETWFAGENSVNSGGNTGWNFSPAYDNFLTFFPAAGA